MNLDNLVRKYVSGSSDYSFDYLGRILPRKIVTVKGKELDFERYAILDGLRKSQSVSAWEPKFTQELGYLNPKNKDVKNMWYYEQQLPIFIDAYREFWLELCDKHGVEASGVRNKNYILPDFYFPNSGVIVEIDGEQHLGAGAVLEDAVRDDFLDFIVGCRPLRFVQFGKSDTTKYMSTLKSTLEKTYNPQLPRRWDVDYTYKTVEYYKHSYGTAWKLFERIFGKKSALTLLEFNEEELKIKREVLQKILPKGEKLNIPSLVKLTKELLGSTLKVV